MNEPRTLLREILGAAPAAVPEPGGVGVSDPRVWSTICHAVCGPATPPGQDRVPNVCAQQRARSRSFSTSIAYLAKWKAAGSQLTLGAGFLLAELDGCHASRGPGEIQRNDGQQLRRGH
jgi:hypothetical protein